MMEDENKGVWKFWREPLFGTMLVVLVLWFCAGFFVGRTLPKAPAKMAKPTIPKGAYGVFVCPSLQTSSPLYVSKANTSRENQKVVDRDNAALWWKYGKGHAIVDHLDSIVGKGQWIVNELKVGDVATLYTKDKTTRYYCSAIWLSKQTKYVYQADFDGNTIGCKSGDIICVSCAWEDGYDYVAYFKPL